MVLDFDFGTIGAPRAGLPGEFVHPYSITKIQDVNNGKDLPGFGNQEGLLSANRFYPMLLAAQTPWLGRVTTFDADRISKRTICPS